MGTLGCCCEMSSRSNWPNCWPGLIAFQWNPNSVEFDCSQSSVPEKSMSSAEKSSFRSDSWSLCASMLVCDPHSKVSCSLRTMRSFSFFQIQQVNLLHGSVWSLTNPSFCSIIYNVPTSLETFELLYRQASRRGVFGNPRASRNRTIESEQMTSASDFTYLHLLSLTLLFAYVFVLTSRRLHVHETHETGTSRVLGAACSMRHLPKEGWFGLECSDEPSLWAHGIWMVNEWSIKDIQVSSSTHIAQNLPKPVDTTNILIWIYKMPSHPSKCSSAEKSFEGNSRNK